MKPITKRIILTALRILIFLILIEIFLWVNQQWNLHLQDKSNTSRLKKGQVYRIICLGDSNTAMGGEHGYVAQMDLILNERSPDIKFEVINKGLPAASSTIIVDHLADWLKEYNPDLVTAMMGANDRVDLVAAGQAKGQRPATSILERFGTYRLFADLLGKVKQSLLSYLPKNDQEPKEAQPQDDPDSIDVDAVQSSEESLETVPDKFAQMMMAAWQLKDQKQYQKASEIFHFLSKSKIKNTSFVHRVRRELADCLERLGKYQGYMQILYLLLSHHPHDVYSTDKLQYYCKERIAEKEVFAVLHQLHKDAPDERAFKGLLGMCYAQYDNIEKASYYLGQYREQNTAGDNMETRKSYLRLAELLNQQGLNGVFIEYPSRSADPLKRTHALINDNDNFLVVDNEEKFKEAHDPQKYHEYFTDRNYEDIGHCTPKGNQILAENIAEAIWNKWFKE